MKSKIFVLVLILVFTNISHTLAYTFTSNTLDSSIYINTTKYFCNQVTKSCETTTRDDIPTYTKKEDCISICNKVYVATSYLPTTTKLQYTLNPNYINYQYIPTTTKPSYISNTNYINYQYTPTTTKLQYISNTNFSNVNYNTTTTKLSYTSNTSYINYQYIPTTTTKPSYILNISNTNLRYIPTTTTKLQYTLSPITNFSNISYYTTTTKPSYTISRSIDLSKAVTITTLPLLLAGSNIYTSNLMADVMKQDNTEEEMQTNSLNSNSKKTMALIVVKTEKDKSFYTNLIDHEQNFDFGIDIISLAEKRVTSSAKKTKEFLWSQKENYDFFVLDENIPYGEIDDGVIKTDYYYAHTDDFAYFKESKFGKWEHYPEIIVSRIKRNQIDFYTGLKKRNTNINVLLGLPIIFFNWEQSSCGVGTYQTDLSYTGDFLKQKLQKINPLMTFLTMYDDISSKLKPEFLHKKIKPRKKPDMTLNAENFAKNENQKNFFVLFNTAEPMDNTTETPQFYRNTFTSALWKDANNDGFAKQEEITKVNIKDFSSMNSARNFAFYFVPLPYKISDITAPLIVTQPFTVGDESSPSTSLTYGVTDDPEGSSVSTAWNAILTDISQGKTFAESTLLGYTNYFKLLKDPEDENSQALQATRLNFFGLSWYTIKDMLMQPEIQLKNNYYQAKGSEIKIPIKNTGDLLLDVTVLENPNIEIVGEFLIKPEETKEITFKKKTTDNVFSNDDTNRLPQKSYVTINLKTNSPKHPNVQFTIEFWE